MTHSPILALLDFTKPFVVETDVSGSGMGAVLSQGRHPIAFLASNFAPGYSLLPLMFVNSLQSPLRLKNGGSIF